LLSSHDAAVAQFVEVREVRGPGLSGRFVRPGRRQTLRTCREAEGPDDIAISPLAFSLIAGPGSLSAAVLVMGRTDNWIVGGSVLAMIMVCLLSTWLAMRAADRLVLLIGSTGADVVGRIFGVLLAGLAVHFVFDGLAAVPFLAG
jgi:multiple antibiotic resistance protein